MTFKPPKTSVAVILLVVGMLLGILLPVALMMVIAAVTDIRLEEYLKFAMLLGEALITVPILIWALIKKEKFRAVFRMHKFQPQYLLYTFLAGIGLIFVLDELERLIDRLFTPPAFMENMEELLRISDWPSAIILIAGVVLIGPLAEEVVFRGFLQQTLEKRLKSVTMAVVYTALAFMISHFNLYWSVNIFIIGFFLSFVTLKANSIWPAFLLHMINNGLSLLFLHYERIIEPYIAFHGHTHPLIFLIALFLLVRYLIKLTKLT
jgi:membrane protease YdiL (CAAX protease family)